MIVTVTVTVRSPTSQWPKQPQQPLHGGSVWMVEVTCCFVSIGTCLSSCLMICSCQDDVQPLLTSSSMAMHVAYIALLCTSGTNGVSVFLIGMHKRHQGRICLSYRSGTGSGCCAQASQGCMTFMVAHLTRCCQSYLSDAGSGLACEYHMGSQRGI